MSIKTILVLLDDSESSLHRLAAAGDLADRHGAHIDGLALSLQDYPYAAVGIEGGAATLAVEEIERARLRAVDVGEKAKSYLRERGLAGGARWSSHEPYGLREAAAIQGRFADIVIAGQPVEEQNYSLRESALEGVLFGSGRPVLLVPGSWRGPIERRHVIVAWDGSREAARALSHATPFIDGADQTTVVIVDPKPGNQDLGEDPGADIAAVLARHCRSVRVDRIPSSGASIAEALLTHAEYASADLIVMGAYGHSHLSEAIFGGVSRDLIHKTTLPLLLSH